MRLFCFLAASEKTLSIRRCEWADNIQRRCQTSFTSQITIANKCFGLVEVKLKCAFAETVAQLWVSLFRLCPQTSPLTFSEPISLSLSVQTHPLSDELTNFLNKKIQHNVLNFIYSVHLHSIFGAKKMKLPERKLNSGFHVGTDGEPCFSMVGLWLFENTSLSGKSWRQQNSSWKKKSLFPDLAARWHTI